MPDAVEDAGPDVPDIGTDADAGPEDTGDPDAGPNDAGPEDVGPEDAGPEDVGLEDTGPEDVGPEDIGPEDVGPEDVGPEDVGPEDVGPEDVGPEDVGPEDVGPDDVGGDEDTSEEDAGSEDVADAVVDETPPVVAIDTPQAEATVVGPLVAVSGTVADDTGVVSVTVNGVDAVLVDGTFTAELNVNASGALTITAVAIDESGNEGSDEVQVTVTLPDVTGPTVVITAPVDGATIEGAVLKVTGTVVDADDGTGDIVSGVGAHLRGGGGRDGARIPNDSAPGRHGRRAVDAHLRPSRRWGAQRGRGAPRNGAAGQHTQLDSDAGGRGAAPGGAHAERAGTNADRLSIRGGRV